MLTILSKKPKNAAASPTGPASPASSTVPMRKRVAGSYSPGVTKTAMAVILATKMTGVLISPVAMAASPMMSADTRLTECPSDCGIRSPASRMISKIRITSSISAKRGSGVAFSAASILYSSCGGKSSGRYTATHTKTPGKNTVR